MDVLTLDIGGNFIKYAMIDEQLKMHGKGKIPTPNDTLENLFLAIDEIFQKFHALDGLAISMPGAIDSDSGIAYTGGALEYI
ncbi:ROK family protein [Enterococcus cecorum]|nr:ROK family protein [Enterococcus cecorum]